MLKILFSSNECTLALIILSIIRATCRPQRPVILRDKRTLRDYVNTNSNGDASLVDSPAVKARHATDSAIDFYNLQAYRVEPQSCRKA